MKGGEVTSNINKLEVYVVLRIKMGLTCKYRFIDGVHKTSNTVGNKYAGVVSRETVQISVVYVVFNGLNILVANIHKCYLNASTTKKHYIVCGPEFLLENILNEAIFKRSLHGIKLSGFFL